MDFRSLLPRATATVTLRELAPRDAAAYAAGTADPDVRRFAHLPEPEYTPERVVDLIDTVLEEGLTSGTLAVLAIADAATDRFLGSLVVFDVTATSAEVGFWLDPASRGRGAARHGLGLVTDAARDGGLSTLRARTLVGNDASRRTLEGTGFRPERAPMLDTTPSGEMELVQGYVVEL